ncbi:MAG: chemotaxis protein CheW [bacterium]
MSESDILDLDALRRDFDLSFARPEAARKDEGVALLALGVAGEPYALRLEDLAFLARAPETAFWGSGVSAFLGLAGLRGEVLPVWDLAGLLGRPGTDSKPAWVACSARVPRWAAAFERYDGLLRASLSEMEPLAGEGVQARCSREVLNRSGLRRPILDLELLACSIRTIREGR